MKFNRSSTDFFNRMLFCSIMLAPLLFPSAHTLALPDSVVGILRFHTNTAGHDAVINLHNNMVAFAHKDNLLQTPRINAGTLWYPYDQGNRISPENLSRYEALCGLLQCSHLLMGKIYQRNRATLIEAKLFLVSEKKFICTFNEPFIPGNQKKTADLLARKVSLFLEGRLPVVSELKVSKGSSMQKVSLSWTCNTDGNNYIISRSVFENGLYDKIGETKSIRFIDTTADEGLKYWYSVSVINGELSGIPATGYGYRKPPNPKSLTPEEVLDIRNKPWPAPVSADEMEKEKLHIQLFEKYYESYFMVAFIIMVGKIYVNSGELLVFRDFKLSSVDPGNRIIYLTKPGMTPIKFHSNRFFRFVRDMHELKIPYDELLPRVIDNAILFCIRSGEKEVKEPDGKISYAPCFEAVALSSEYVRDYEKWRSATLVFATSDEDLYRRIREAQMKGY
jgi:hypothetical protein